jgi:hypothetical protein
VKDGRKELGFPEKSVFTGKNTADVYSAKKSGISKKPEERRVRSLRKFKGFFRSVAYLQQVRVAAEFTCSKWQEQSSIN